MFDDFEFGAGRDAMSVVGGRWSVVGTVPQAVVHRVACAEMTRSLPLAVLYRPPATDHRPPTDKHCPYQMRFEERPQWKKHWEWLSVEGWSL